MIGGARPRTLTARSSHPLALLETAKDANGTALSSPRPQVIAHDPGRLARAAAMIDGAPR